MELLKIDKYRNEVLQDLERVNSYYIDPPKDILIVVRDQLRIFQKCIETLQENTTNYNLYIWNNASNKETTEFINSLNATVITSEDNKGFIIPNNRLIERTKSPYIILINSDVFLLSPSWAKLIVATLDEGYSQVGYEGSKLGDDLQGTFAYCGDGLDYISGWCFGIKRETYEKFGLFDEKNLQFAYGEDSDFSLRLLEAGEKIYASPLNNVYHLGNQTIQQVRKERDVVTTFEQNHLYMNSRWKNFLNDRKTKH